MCMAHGGLQSCKFSGASVLLANPGNCSEYKQAFLNVQCSFIYGFLFEPGTSYLDKFTDAIDEGFCYCVISHGL